MNGLCMSRQPAVGHFEGVPVYVSPLLEEMPRMTLSEKVPVTAEFRAKTNAWMLEFFGVEHVILKLVNPTTLVVGEKTWQQLRKQAGTVWSAS